MSSPATVVAKVAALLASEAHERQIAAAIVLGELGVRDAATIAALARAIDGGLPPVQRHALDALARLLRAGTKSDTTTGSPPAAALKEALPRVLACCASRDEAVRRAAADAAVALGDAAVAPIRARLGDATEPVERRTLEEILGRVGGKSAFAALLDALDTPDVDAARAAALAVRQQIKDASPREKAAYLAQITKLLEGRAASVGNAKKTARTNGAAGAPAGSARVTGALKILGYLEDAAAIPTLLAFTRDRRQPIPVREEAIVALRFAARGRSAPRGADLRVGGALLDVADAGSPELARAALYTLASIEIPAALAPRLRRLALSGAPESARLALERLAQIPGAPGADGLAAVVAATGDRGQAEAAADGLAARPDGPLALARALMAAGSQNQADRAVLLARLLRPRARALVESGAPGRKLSRALLADLLTRVGRDGAAAAEAFLPLARELDRDATTAGLRELAGRLQKRRDAAGALAILRLVGHGADATPDDGYALAVAELRAGRRDDALIIVQQLADRGFDLAAALRRDRQLTPEQRYQVGFALAEHRHPAGEEVLTDLSRGPRSKVTTMAKAKLKSAGYS